VAQVDENAVADALDGLVGRGVIEDDVRGLATELWLAPSSAVSACTPGSGSQRAPRKSSSRKWAATRSVAGIPRMGRIGRSHPKNGHGRNKKIPSGFAGRWQDVSVPATAPSFPPHQIPPPTRRFPQPKPETIMKTTMKNSNLTILAAAALAAVVLTSTSARAGIEVTPGHLQGTPTFAVQGTLLAIDEPSSMDTTTTFINGPAGPDWTDDADDGFSVLTGAQIAINEWRAGMWEPDGTPDTGDNVSYMFNKPGKSVTWAFDLPDGSIVHNVWATWFHQGNSGTGHTYTVDEGTPMTFTKTAAAGSTGNLVLQWTAADASVYNSTFQRIFAGPIVVAGGDGFKVTFTQVQSGTYPYIDAVVVDYTIPAGGDIVFTFDRDQKSIDGPTTAIIEVGTTLASWPETCTVPDGATGPVNPGVTVVKDPSVGFDTVTLTVPQAPDTRKFARLKVTVP
jgi:hypothetical protein